MNEKSIFSRLKAQVGKTAQGINEIWVQILISVGIPAIFYIYIDWKAALTAFILSQIVLGIVRERYS